MLLTGCCRRGRQANGLPWDLTLHVSQSKQGLGWLPPLTRSSWSVGYCWVDHKQTRRDLEKGGTLCDAVRLSSVLALWDSGSCGDATNSLVKRVTAWKAVAFHAVPS